MKKKAFKILLLIALVSLLVLTLLIFLPRKYNVTQQKVKAGIEYWDLSTGSRIAYSFIPGQDSVHPFPVIYLHGGPGGQITDKILEDLYPLSQKGYDVYLYDQVGSGYSERLEDIREYSSSRHKKDLVEIIDNIGAEKVIIIGQSWGAMLATLYITDYPDKVDKAVFTSPGPILPIHKQPAEVKAPDSLNLRAPRFTNKMGNEKIYHIRAKCTLWWAYASGGKLVTDAEADNFFTFLNRELNKSTLCDPGKAHEVEAGGGYYAHIMTIKSFNQVTDQRSKMKKIKVPILLMKGQCDNQKWGVTREYMDLFSNHQLVLVENAGHSISAEEPVVYLHNLLDFLNN